MNKKLYSEKLVKKVNKLKESTLKFAEKVNSQKDSRIECGILYDTISRNWKSIDATVFYEEPSELERQIDAAIKQAYRISV